MKILVSVSLGIILVAAQPVIAQINTVPQMADAASQSGQKNLPRFEVATIKPIAPTGMHGVGVDVLPGGKVIIQTASLKDLIVIAYGLNYWQISGGENWMADARYDVVALPPEKMRLQITDLRHDWFGIHNETLRQMLQALLIDRFQLKFHTETRTGPEFLLEKNGKRLRLRPTKATAAGRLQYPSGEIGTVDGRFSLYDSTMPELAQIASTLLHRPVLDRTGLAGSFDYKSQVQDDPSDLANDFPDSFLRFVSELGLKLKPAKGPVETFVIDHAERPSPN